MKRFKRRVCKKKGSMVQLEGGDPRRNRRKVRGLSMGWVDVNFAWIVDSEEIN